MSSMVRQEKLTLRGYLGSRYLLVGSVLSILLVFCLVFLCIVCIRPVSCVAGFACPSGFILFLKVVGAKLFSILYLKGSIQSINKIKYTLPPHNFRNGCYHVFTIFQLSFWSCKRSVDACLKQLNKG